MLTFINLFLVKNQIIYYISQYVSILVIPVKYGLCFNNTRRNYGQIQFVLWEESAIDTNFI